MTGVRAKRYGASKSGAWETVGESVDRLVIGELTQRTFRINLGSALGTVSDRIIKFITGLVIIIVDLLLI